MAHDIRKYLLDAEHAISLIRSFTENLSEADFLDSLLVQSAVERQLAIVGEALGAALKLMPHLPITDAKRIVKFRNFIVHAYDLVHPAYIWSIIVQHLPLLSAEISSLLSEVPPPLSNPDY